MSPVKANAEELKLENEKASQINKERGKAKGTRVKVGQTRGKNPNVISWEFFDRLIPESLPTSYAEFCELTKTTEEKDIVNLLIEGHNSFQYAEASDEIGEFVEDYWDKDTATQFRTTIRQFSKAANMEIEDAVKLLKPAVEAGYQARKQAAEAASQPVA